MPPDAATPIILEPQSRVDALLAALAPERWPIRVQDLPKGTALVGGAVRDALLGRLRQQPDLDLVVPDGALPLSRQLAASLGGSVVVLDEERDMARLVLHGWTIDIASCDGPSLETDLQRRDFRLNAIALPLQPAGDLIDPTGGLQDLLGGTLVAVCETNLTDDPLRLLRGLRLMAEIPLQLEPQTAQWIALHRGRLTTAAPERILSELQRLVAAPWADEALTLLQRLGLLGPWQDASNGWDQPPAASQAADMSASERSLALPLARLAYLTSDDGLKRLKASKKLTQRCQRLRHWTRKMSGNPDKLSEQGRLALHSELEHDLPALILGCPTQLRAEWLSRWRDANDPLFHPASPLNGSTLQTKLGLKPGPALGQLIEHLRCERAFHRISGETSALVAAQHWCSLLSDLL